MALSQAVLPPALLLAIPLDLTDSLGLLPTNHQFGNPVALIAVRRHLPKRTERPNRRIPTSGCGRRRVSLALNSFLRLLPRLPRRLRNAPLLE
jgi:hypothetical protein